MFVVCRFASTAATYQSVVAIRLIKFDIFIVQSNARQNFCFFERESRFWLLEFVCSLSYLTISVCLRQFYRNDILHCRDGVFYAKTEHYIYSCLALEMIVVLLKMDV